ncbi:hypothetical protein [Sulfobacillus thermosulfidooxidans]|uniref:hypothetical protein n=1 Tax=Sulfobacillus thermosulfidooxidans TaxID=28034 RepID=UPI0006B486E2|nr:hypothetical protein [Sulfobacillus thermosulfidooxidans]
MGSNKLYNYFNGEGYLESEYLRIKKYRRTLKNFLQQAKEIIRVFETQWPEGEGYWLPLVQQLRFDDIQVPESINTFWFQDQREQLNAFICEIVQESEHFTHMVHHPDDGPIPPHKWQPEP